MFKGERLTDFEQSPFGKQMPPPPPPPGRVQVLSIPLRQRFPWQKIDFKYLKRVSFHGKFVMDGTTWPPELAKLFLDYTFSWIQSRKIFMILVFLLPFSSLKASCTYEINPSFLQTTLVDAWMEKLNYLTSLETMKRKPWKAETTPQQKWTR